MVPAKKTFFYFLMRQWCYIGSRMYFKKVETKYIEPLPKDKPIIFVGNHNNTFIDPILISVNTGLYPAFLTTAAAFKIPAVAKFLHAIRMLPIYRQRDGRDSIQKNELIFDISMKQLEANLQFVIFAEGSHSPYRRLRDFKKGFARIGFGALKRNDGELDVQIVPVGVEYRQFGKMHQEVTQTYGKAIPLKDYWEEYQKNEDSALIKLRNHVYDALQDLLIHIPTEQHYEAVESLRNFTRPWLHDFKGLKNPGLYEMMVAEKEMISAQTSYEKQEPEKMAKFADKINDLQAKLDAQNFRSHLLKNPVRSKFMLILQALIMVVLSPIYLLGVLAGYVPYKIPDIISRKVFKDNMYWGAVNYAGGLAFFSLFGILEIFAVHLIFGNGWITLAFALLMPLVMIFSFRYWLELKKMWHRWRFVNFKQKNNGAYDSLKQQYNDIIAETEEMMTTYASAE